MIIVFRRVVFLRMGPRLVSFELCVLFLGRFGRWRLYHFERAHAVASSGEEEKLDGQQEAS